VLTVVLGELVYTPGLEEFIGCATVRVVQNACVRVCCTFISNLLKNELR
jgi:hypothetical protein